jgi:putative FmdB family regulatory protein
MPIYEFYCQPCHRVYQFFSSRIDTGAAPACPRCGTPRLPRKPATFSTLSRRRGEEEGDEGLPEGFDEERLGGALESILAEAEAQGDSEDPRRMAALLRRFGEAAGLEPGERLEEMLHRLEAGEDPEALEEEGGDAEEGEDLSDFFRLKRALAGARRKRPPVDPELYFL